MLIILLCTHCSISLLLLICVFSVREQVYLAVEGDKSASPLLVQILYMAVDSLWRQRGIFQGMQDEVCCEQHGNVWYGGVVSQ